MKTLNSIALAAVLLLMPSVESSASPAKIRTIITTDGEIDDQCSLVRYMVYANMFELDGLVSSASKFHYQMKEGEKFYGRESNQRWIDAYAKVYDNLCKHADGFPTPEYLTSINVEGNIYVPGEMMADTPGSLLIKKCIMDDREDLLFLQVWGGTDTIAAALRSIEDAYKNKPQWRDVYNKVCKKIQIWIDLDQDNTVNDYILPHWPGVKIIMSYSQFGAFAYGWRHLVPEGLHKYLKGEFMGRYIANKSNALSQIYYNNLTDPSIPLSPKEKNLDFLSEGDTPNYFYILDNGLRSWEDPSWGGWAGRFVPSRRYRNLWVDAYDDGDLYKPLWRWIEPEQTEFAARLQWCTASFAEANHEPSVEVEEGENIKAERGGVVTLTAKTHDPDGNKVSVSFWQYSDADSYAGQVALRGARKGDKVTFTVPADARHGDTIHIIVAAKDDAALPITRYRRVVVTVD